LLTSPLFLSISSNLCLIHSISILYLSLVPLSVFLISLFPSSPCHI
jgi:hypothetical protein